MSRDTPHPARQSRATLSRKGRGKRDRVGFFPSPFTGEGAERSEAGEGIPAWKRARVLRKAMTDAERKLWGVLRGRRFSGIKFRRQEEIGTYIVDFVSFETRIIVEVDGSQHVENSYDKTRDRWLAAQGFTVLRFWNSDALNDLEGVLDAIAQAVRTHPSPGAAEPRRPLPQGEREDASYWIEKP